MPGSQVPQEVRVFVPFVSIFVVSFIDEYCKVDELCPGCVVSCKCLVAASGLKIGDTWNSECRLVHRAAANALSWLALLALLALPCLALPFVKIGDTWNSECGLVHKAAANALSWLAFCLAFPCLVCLELFLESRCLSPCTPSFLSCPPYPPPCSLYHPEQVFNDLDVQDDKMMLDLAVFLNRLVRQRKHNNFGFLSPLLAALVLCSTRLVGQ